MIEERFITREMERGQRILIADDGLVGRKLLERRLVRLGFEVVCVDDGVQALEHVRAAPPHAVITDLHMPNLDGFELCRAIRRELHLDSIVLIVASAREVNTSDVQVAIDAGANAYVTRKPDLLEVVAALLGALRMDR